MSKRFRAAAYMRDYRARRRRIDDRAQAELAEDPNVPDVVEGGLGFVLCGDLEPSVCS